MGPDSRRRDDALAETLLVALGGGVNVASTTHCATRLRVTPHDLDRVDRAAIEGIPGVIAVTVAARQVQVVVGPGRVDAVHTALERRLAGSGAAAEKGASPAAPRHRAWPARATGVLVDVFTPLLPAFVAGGLLSALHNVLAGPGLVGDESITGIAPWLTGFVALVGLLGSAVFALLPVLLGFSATGRFGGSPYLGAAMGATLVAAPLLRESDALPALHLSPSAGWSIAGVDVLAIDYRGTVLPMIAIAYVLARIERALTRRSSGSARLLLVPLLTLLLTGLVAFLLLGPTLSLAGELAAEGMQWLYSSAGILGGTVVGAVYSPLVVTGLHQGLIAIELGLLAEGGSFIFPIAAAANVAQAAACLAVWLCAGRGSRLRGLAGTATAPAALGIAEPAMFAVTLRLRVPFVLGVASTSIAATLLAAFRVDAVTLGAAGVFGFASIAPGSVGAFLVCLAVSAGGAFAGTYAWARWRRARGRPIDEQDERDTRDTHPERNTQDTHPERDTQDTRPERDTQDTRPERDTRDTRRDDTLVRAPVNGTLVDVGTLGDPLFARSALGPTAAIEPSDGRIHAPAAGVVTAVAATRHAYGITTDAGVELLVHVGIDTVRLAGAGFSAHVSTGRRVEQGAPLADVDLAAVGAAGLDPVVLTIVTNADARAVLTPAAAAVSRGVPVLRILDGRR